MKSAGFFSVQLRQLGAGVLSLRRERPPPFNSAKFHHHGLRLRSVLAIPARFANKLREKCRACFQPFGRMVSLLQYNEGSKLSSSSTPPIPT